MRLFVALELPEAAMRSLHDWAGELAARSMRDRAGEVAAGDLRPVPAENLHVTLCFLGERDEREVPGIGPAVASAVAAGPAVALSVSGSVWLPRRRPRLLAVTVDGPDLGALQARVSAALVAGEWYRPEGRPFLGHVTVSRMGGGGRGRGASLTAALPPPPPPRLTFTASTVAVMRSRLGSGPARYEALARIALPDGPVGGPAGQ